MTIRLKTNVSPNKNRYRQASKPYSEIPFFADGEYPGFYLEHRCIPAAALPVQFLGLGVWNTMRTFWRSKESCS